MSLTRSVSRAVAGAIRMGREMGGTSIGGGVITTGHDEAWDVSALGARVNVWHHVALVYDSDTVHFIWTGSARRTSRTTATS